MGRETIVTIGPMSAERAALQEITTTVNKDRAGMAVPREATTATSLNMTSSWETTVICTTKSRLHHQPSGGLRVFTCRLPTAQKMPRRTGTEGGAKDIINLGK